MRLRMYAATVTGTLAFMLASMGLLLFSELNVGEMFFVAIIAYMAGIGAVLWFTEPKAKRAEQRTEKVETAGGNFKIFDLKAGTEFVEKR